MVDVLNHAFLLNDIKMSAGVSGIYEPDVI